MAEDQRKLSLKFPLMRDVMIEASAMAAMKQSALVEAEHLEEALEARMYRANLVEELYMEEYDRELIKVRTSGSAVGRVKRPVGVVVRGFRVRPAASDFLHSGRRARRHHRP